MRKLSTLFIATALCVAPAGLVFAADTTTSGSDQYPKVTSETNMTGRGNVDATGKPMGANPRGRAATQGANGRTGGSGIGRGHVDATGKAMGASGGASMGYTGGLIGRGHVDPTGRASGRYAILNTYEEAKIAVLNMPQNTQAERDARASVIARADAMRR